MKDPRSLMRHGITALSPLTATTWDGEVRNSGAEWREDEKPRMNQREVVTYSPERGDESVFAK